MNPYSILSSGIGSAEAASLGARMKSWHDAMVAHERRLRTGRNACNDECPHSEAQALWAEAQTMFGPRACELTFLQSRADMRQPIAHEVAAANELIPNASHSATRSAHTTPQHERHREILSDSPDRSPSALAAI
jgi:hypothetical protein